MGVELLSSRAIIGTFYEELDRITANQQSLVNRLAFFVQATQREETYRWLGQVPQMREWNQGGRELQKLRDNEYKIKNKIWESTLEFQLDDLRLDKTGQVRIRIGELADRAVDHVFKLVSELIVAGETTAGYDGFNFFHTAHVEHKSGTQNNDITLNVGTPSTPTQQEMADAILDMLEAMYGFKDDQGEPINQNAKNFIVMTPTNLWGTALAAVNNNILAGANPALQTNPLGPLQSQQGITIDVINNPRLTASDKLYLFRTDGRVRPFIHQEEQGIRVQAVAEGSELEFKTRSHWYGVDAIRNVGYGLWQHAVLMTLN